VNLAVFGATGRTGRPLVAAALERGHSVTAFARSVPAGGALDGVERVVTGDARNAAAVASAIRGADAVISAMGPRDPDPGTSYSEAIGTLVRAMVAAGAGRLVIAANARVLDDRPLEGEFAAVSQEHRDAYATLRASDLAWTIVATPYLDDGQATGSYDAVVGGRAQGRSISRSDFAIALLDALDDPAWIGAVVGVADATTAVAGSTGS
jgi:putative NADH-flavin reductase